MRVQVNESSWCRLEDGLSEWKYKRDKGELLTDFEIGSIGFQWLAQKALGIRKAQVPAVAEQIRQLGDEIDLDLSQFTDEEAQIAWQTGRKVAKRAREDVSKWLPAA
jgi:hypothetical protein